jgi:transposase
MVGDRIVPTDIFVEICGGLLQPDLSMKIEVRQGIPVCSEVCFRSRPDGPEVRERHLTQVQLGWLIEQIVARASMKVSGRIGEPAYGWSKPVNDKSALAEIRQARSGRSRISQEQLSKVAEVYREHLSNRPTEAVSRAFGVSHRTAARHVQQARERGLLPPTVPGKKKA